MTDRGFTTKTWPVETSALEGQRAVFSERPELLSETFRYTPLDWQGITYEWDIKELQRLANGREITLQEIKPLAEILINDWDAGWGIKVDPIRVLTDPRIDTSLPSLSLPLPFPAAPDDLHEYHTVVDGWRRIARLCAEGATQVPMVLMTRVDEAACRIRPTTRELREILIPQIAARSAEIERTTGNPQVMRVPSLDGLANIDILPPVLGALCDFCSGRPVAWCYPARAFRLEAYRWESIGNWAACEACSLLVEDGAYLGLAQRCISALARRDADLEDPAIRRRAMDFVATQHSLFALNRTGPRHPHHAQDQSIRCG